MKRWTCFLGIALILCITTATAQPQKGLKGKGPRVPPPRAQASCADAATGGEDIDSDVSIQWFATLERGMAEAKRTGRPILFVSAAPHCAGVSGMW